MANIGVGSSVLVRAPLGDAVDKVLRQVEPSCNIGLPHTSGDKRADNSSLLIRDNRIVVSLARRHVSSAFSKHVAHVLAVRTGNEMRRIHAWRIVASVKNIESLRNGAVSQFPRQPMSADRALAAFRSPVASPRDTPTPKPTFFRRKHIDTAPKSNRDWLPFMNAVAQVAGISIFTNSAPATQTIAIPRLAWKLRARFLSLAPRANLQRFHRSSSLP